MLVTTGFNSTQSPVFTLGNWACLPLFHFWPGWTSPSFYSPLEHMPLGSINSCSALKNQDNVAAQMRIIAMPPGHDGNLWHQYLLFSCFKSYLYINGNATYSTTINVCRGPLLPNLHPCVWPGLECARCPPAFYLGHTDYERVHTNIYIFFKTDPCFFSGDCLSFVERQIFIWDTDCHKVQTTFNWHRFKSPELWTQKSIREGVKNMLILRPAWS